MERASARIGAPREVFRFVAYFLFILAGWTLVIKFAFPLAFALAEGEPPLTHIYWDFWWAIHIWLGWSLLSWPRYTRALALGVSVAEIVIVAIKLALFLAAPEWTIWNTNWFINSRSGWSGSSPTRHRVMSGWPDRSVSNRLA